MFPSVITHIVRTLIARGCKAGERGRGNDVRKSVARGRNRGFDGLRSGEKEKRRAALEGNDGEKGGSLVLN